MSGFELLERDEKATRCYRAVPVIVYTGKELGGEKRPNSDGWQKRVSCQGREIARPVAT